MAAAVPESPRSGGGDVTAERLTTFLNLENSVRTWIESTLNIPLRGDFMEAIKNGIVLCYLMRELDEHSIPRVQDATPLPSMLAQENISFFLAAAAEYGVSPHKRFFPFDLWNGNSRPRVVESLAELARVAAAKQFRVILKVTDLPLDKLPFPMSEAQTKVLVEQLSKTRTRETGAARKDAPGIFKRKLALLVSQKEYPDFERRWTRIQALMRGRAARNKFQSRVLNQAFRDKIAHELQETETTYLTGLKTLIDKYLSPLKTGSWNKKLLLPPQTVKKLFSDIEIIHNVNAILKSNIDKAMESWGPSSQLGNVFVQVMNFLKVYANYVSTADAQLQEYDSLLKNNKLFMQFVDEVRVSAPGMLDIPGYLIMPIQRVPRYFMLLERLMKHTWKDHRDYADLEKSVAGLQSVALHLNEQKRKFENIRSVIAFQSSIVGCPQITMPTRCLVQQFEVEDKKKSEWLLVLFNDSVLVAKTDVKKGTSTHKFKEHLMFPDVEVTPDSDKSLDLLAKGGVVLKMAITPTATAFSQQLPTAKASFKSIRDSRYGADDDGSNVSAALQLALEAPPEQPITAEELLKQREVEKKQLKQQMAEEMKLLRAPGTSVPDRNVSPSRRPSTALPALRSTQSLLKMKAIVEQQITVLETFREEGEGDAGDSDEIRRMASNLSDELAELDKTLEDVKGGLTPEAREALNMEESAVRLKVSEEPKTMRSKKKPRRSFFSFFSSSTVSADGSPAKDAKPSGTPPSSSKLTPTSTKLKGSGKHGSPGKQDVPSPSASPQPGATAKN
jgi:hypothetical protein